MPVRLKMKTGLSGPKYSLAPNDEHEFSDYEAKRLIEAGFAERVETEKQRAERLKAEANAANDAAKANAEAQEKAEEEAAAQAAARAEAEAKAKADAEAGAGDASPDAGDASDATGDASAGTADAEQPAYTDLASARKAYKGAYGKNPAPSWSIEQLTAKIAEHQAKG